MKTDEQLIYEQYDNISQVMSRIKDGKIEGDVDLSNLHLHKLPDLSQVEVTGDFWCGGNQLTSLEGAPHTVGGGFHCSYNQLTSLVGAPHTVGGNFYCRNNQLTSLEGAPHTVDGDFDCEWNELTSLDGIPPHIGGKMYSDFSKEKVQQAIKKAQQAEMKHHARNDDSMVTDLLDF